MSSLNVASVQLALAYASTPQEFFDRVREPIERAARDGAQLIALPNYTGLMLLGIALPIAQGAGSTPPRLDEIARGARFPSVGAMLRSVAPTMSDFYVHLFGSLAQRLQVYLAPGTVIELETNRLYNTAYLFAPDGTIVGSQRQTHRSRDESAWGMARGNQLNVFDAGSMRVGFVVGTDVEYPEVSRILALQNANLLIHPAAYMSWHAEHFLLDLWREVQANQVFGLEPCAVALGQGGQEIQNPISIDGADNRMGQGQSAIYAPVEMTDDHRGFLAQAEHADQEEVVSATLDFDALQRVIDDYSIFGYFNYEFYGRTFPVIYQGGES